MGRLVGFLLVAAAMGYGAYVYLSGHQTNLEGLAPGTSGPANPTVVVPTRAVDNARQTARQIENDTQQRVDDLFDRTK